MKTVKIYKCEKCGNIVLKLEDLSEELACCGSPMVLLKANTSDGASEKHVPIINAKVKDCDDSNGQIVEIQVGSTPHPMLPEHHISWIGTFNDTAWSIKWLKTGGKPNAVSLVQPDTTIYEYCNLHGLWKK